MGHPCIELGKLPGISRLFTSPRGCDSLRLAPTQLLPDLDFRRFGWAFQSAGQRLKSLEAFPLVLLPEFSFLPEKINEFPALPGHLSNGACVERIIKRAGGMLEFMTQYFDVAFLFSQALERIEFICQAEIGP